MLFRSPQVYIGSADWMDRNLSRRVEVVWPIEQADIKHRLIAEILATTMADSDKARELLPDGTYRHVELAAGQPRVRSQERFLELASAAANRVLGGVPPAEEGRATTRPTKRRPRQSKTSAAATTPKPEGPRTDPDAP